MAAISYTSGNNWEFFLSRKADAGAVYGAVDCGGKLVYERLTPSRVPSVVYTKARPVTPLKLFLFPFKESVLPAVSPTENAVVIGPASCDLAGLSILDRVFAGGEFKDPSYPERRARLTIVSVDCQQPYQTCFCESVGVRPYAERLFDVNLTALADGFLVEVGSEKGAQFLEGLQTEEAGGDRLAQRAALREKAARAVREINSQFDLADIPERIRGIEMAERWQTEDVSRCVQCGSCNFNCPTCVCFLLEDTGTPERFEKMRLWDACLFPGYARMAGGATPRRTLFERYAHRLLCKYSYMVDNFGTVGCTGCGRCIAGCIGRIDKRKVLSEVVVSRTPA